MRTIYKYSLRSVSYKQQVSLPDNSKVLHVGVQNDQIMLWALLQNTDNLNLVAKNFYVVATGGPVPETPTDYIGTVQIGVYVWHVFMELGTG